MNDSLKILGEAIADVGVWQWWQSDSTDSMQIEFNGTQLWNSPVQKGQPPSGKIALAFEDVKCAAFLTFDSDRVKENWPQLLHDDELDGFNLSEGSLTFTDAAIISEFISDAVAITSLYGVSFEQSDWTSAPVKIGFRAGPVGVVLAAKQMSLLNFEGEFELNQVESKNEQWWKYWNEYWRLIDTPDALPEDYACEVTIPTGD